MWEITVFEIIFFILEICQIRIIIEGTGVHCLYNHHTKVAPNSWKIKVFDWKRVGTWLGAAG